MTQHMQDGAIEKADLETRVEILRQEIEDLQASEESYKQVIDEMKKKHSSSITHRDQTIKDIQRQAETFKQSEKDALNSAQFK